MLQSLTPDADHPGGSISALVATSDLQLKVAHLRHGEIHEVPACDVDRPGDVARLPEHHLSQVRTAQRRKEQLFWYKK